MLLLRDPCFAIYSLIIAVSLFGLALFIWWWKKIGKASEVYIYFTLLLASEAFYNFFNALARYIRIQQDSMDDFVRILDHPIWTFRAILHLAILGTIVGRMTTRVVMTIAKAQRFKLEEGEDSKEDMVEGEIQKCAKYLWSKTKLYLKQWFVRS